MSVFDYKGLKNHVGHKLQCVTYGEDENAAIECIDCNEVLMDFDKVQKTFTVHFMTSYCKWEGVEADTQDEAISKCPIPNEFDLNEPGSFIAIEEE